MNIDNLTYGELKQIVSMLSGAKADNANHPMIGKYCIARCYAAGVHAGIVVSADDHRVILKNSRRLWSWKANTGVALSGVAQTGIDPKESKVDVENPEIYLTGVCELIPCTREAQDSIESA